MSFPVIVGIVLVVYLLNSIKVLNEYERAVIFRLGRILSKPKGPGVILVFFPIDRLERVSLRTVTLDVPPQDIITKDNVSVKVNAVVYYRVMNPTLAIIEVEDYHFATSQMSQTSLRSTVGQVNLDELLSEREKINSELQLIIDKATDPLGVKVSHVEIKHVDLPQEMQRAMAKQAEAERERRAKVISAEGEYQASEKLAQAAQVLQRQPMSLQMRYLQTLMDISTEKSSIIVFPLPMEMLGWFKTQGEK
ncbi:MAG: slipin family protein [Candidatus Omnitrophica bacterium]|nr:slipin family protein [Candidatus Omnitrophota bacterium]